MRSRSGLFLLPFALSLVSSLAAPQPEGSIPFKFEGHYIVVEGSALGEHPLKLMVDTGASYSLLDQRVAKTLRLKSYAVKGKVNSFGHGQKITQRVSLPRLRVGPILVTLPCFVADLSSYKVDAILGMDLLGRADFTIDFAHKQIHFGSRDPLPVEAAFQQNSSGAVVTLELDGHEVELLLDSGANRLFLFGDRVGKWIRKYAVQKRGYVDCLEGRVPASFITLQNIRMGQTHRRRFQAVVLPRQNGTDADGTLGLVSLKLSRIHFDFRNGIVSWEG